MFRVFRTRGIEARGAFNKSMILGNRSNARRQGGIRGGRRSRAERRRTIMVRLVNLIYITLFSLVFRPFPPPLLLYGMFLSFLNSYITTRALPFTSGNVRVVSKLYTNRSYRVNLRLNLIRNYLFLLTNKNNKKVLKNSPFNITILFRHLSKYTRTSSTKLVRIPATRNFLDSILKVLRMIRGNLKETSILNGNNFLENRLTISSNRILNMMGKKVIKKRSFRMVKATLIISTNISMNSSLQHNFHNNTNRVIVRSIRRFRYRLKVLTILTSRRRSLNNIFIMNISSTIIVNRHVNSMLNLQRRNLSTTRAPIKSVPYTGSSTRLIISRRDISIVNNTNTRLKV